MNSKANGTIHRGEKLNHIQGEGPNWVLIAGGALLSTLSIRLGCKLKQVFEAKRQDNAFKENGKGAANKRPGAGQSHSNSYRFAQDEDRCYHCFSGISEGVDLKQDTNRPELKDADPSLPLVKIPVVGSNRDNDGVMWASSPDRLEPPRKPFHHSNSSDSPCVSESGSDIYSKREVIQKLRQQLKRRDEMIIEMQAQITDLQNSLQVQMAQSANLQSQLDSTNRDLFDSERDIQRLRKVIADHCVAETVSPEKPVIMTRTWRPGTLNGHVNGYPDSVDDLDLHCVGGEKGRGDGGRIGMLKREVEELKEVIEGKDFLLQSYKEQKVELWSKIKDLELKLVPQAQQQVPDIL